MIRFQFVEDHRDTHEVKRMCQVLRIQRSSYYKWQAGRQARQAKQAADQAVVVADRAGWYCGSGELVLSSVEPVLARR